jgi:hypothetical protein
MDTALTASELIVLDQEPGSFALYGWQNVAIVVWASPATGPFVDRLARALRPFIDAHPEGITNVHLVTRAAGTPTAAAREGFVDMMTTHSRRLACVAIVLEGGGLWAAPLKSAIVGMRGLAPRSFQLRMHDSLEDVPRWVTRAHLKRTGVLLHPKQLRSLLVEARGFLAPSIGERAKILGGHD